MDDSAKPRLSVDPLPEPLQGIIGIIKPLENLLFNARQSAL